MKNNEVILEAMNPSIPLISGTAPTSCALSRLRDFFSNQMTRVDGLFWEGFC